ncbi:MAG: Asp-tRNA(Asn)/Glu-tRNA(Gln) amidotransferase subunit GatC [Terriglobales bacterium]
MDIAHIAILANLDLDAGEAADLERDLTAILAYVGRLGAVDTTGIEPMAQALTETSAPREDQPRTWFTAAQALANAPASAADMFQVPKILDRG